MIETNSTTLTAHLLSQTIREEDIDVAVISEPNRNHVDGIRVIY